MKRAFTVMVLAGMVVGALLVGPALSQGHSDGDGPPPHGHLLLTGLEFDEEGEPVGYKKCRELANGQPVPLNAHHEHLHTGRAGEAQWEAGNATVPLAPLTPWSNCEEFAAFVFGE